MNKLMSLLFVAVFAVLTGCSGKSATSPTGNGGVVDIGANNPEVIVANGDSIISGGEVAGLVQNYLRSAGKDVSVINRAVAGSYSDELLGRFPGVLASDRPAVAIQNIGTNDGLTDSRAENTVNNLRQMVGMAKANQTIIVLSTLPPVCGYRIESGQAERIDRINSDIRDLAKQYRGDDYVAFADIAQAIANGGGCNLIRSIEVAGRVMNHLDEDGEKAYARKMAETIAALNWE